MGRDRRPYGIQRWYSENRWSLGWHRDDAEPEDELVHLPGGGYRRTRFGETPRVSGPGVLPSFERRLDRLSDEIGEHAAIDGDYASENLRRRVFSIASR